MKRTEAQRWATSRNFAIMCLKGTITLCRRFEKDPLLTYVVFAIQRVRQSAEEAIEALQRVKSSKERIRR